MTIRNRKCEGLGMLCLALSCPPAIAEAPVAAAFGKAEQAGIFKAAGAVRHKGLWVICSDDPNPSGATIEPLGDLNGDGRPEALVTEGGSFCHGATGAGYTLVSRQADGGWRKMAAATGMAVFLKTRGADGWPDISVGGPGFCFPVERWDGKAYKFHRFEYEGKRCKPPR